MSRIKFVEDYYKNLSFFVMFASASILNISDIFCNGDLVNAQTWEVLSPGETGFNRATLRVHFFLPKTAKEARKNLFIRSFIRFILAGKIIPAVFNSHSYSQFMHII